MDEIGAHASDEAALTWFVRLRDEATSPQDRRAFEAWLREDPAHERACREIERVWSGLDLPAAEKPIGPPAAAPAPATMARRRPRRTAWRPLAAAAMILVALAAGWRLLPTGLFADHRTGIGERRTVLLADGSQVELGPGSAIDLDFSAGRRGVRLLAGEAFFTVARDPGRPFVVAARQGQIAVLGTAFDVKIGTDEAVSVVVAESRVAVSARRGEAVPLGAGQAVSYDDNGVSPVRPADLDAVQAWRQDQLVFHDAPLDAVLSELRRYRYGHIQLLGGDLGQRRVTAVFDARRPDAALDTIARSLDLRLLRATGLFVALVAW